MFERFTDRARHVVVLAQEEARRLQHNYIGTEHVLLGLLGEPDQIAGRVLGGFGLTLGAGRDDVIARVGTGKSLLEGHIPFTPRSKKVLELALREALALGHNYIGTEHILLGLVREGKGTGADIVAAHAPEPTEVRVRMAVLDLLPAMRPETSRRWFRRRAAEAAAGSENVQLATTPAADATLDAAARLAGSRPVGSQHLLLAALADSESAAARALITLGLDVTKVEDALRTVDVSGTTDEAPEEAGRRALRLRVADDHVILEATDPFLVDLARAAVEAVADTDEPGSIAGTLDVATSFGDVWLALRDSLEDIRRRTAVSEPESESDAG